MVTVVECKHPGTEQTQNNCEKCKKMQKMKEKKTFATPHQNLSLYLRLSLPQVLLTMPKINLADVSLSKLHVYHDFVGLLS